MSHGTEAAPATPTGGAPFDPAAITRPAPVLMTYYVIIAIMSLFGAIVVLPVLYFKYHSLRYRFDKEGISMSWGVLFRHETHLTYRRIQDIHVTRGIIQRWLGLTTISVQTAGGSSTSEMNIEGVLQADELRDYLYRMMRGAHGDVEAAPAVGATGADEPLALLRDIRDQLRRLQSLSPPSR